MRGPHEFESGDLAYIRKEDGEERMGDIRRVLSILGYGAMHFFSGGRVNMVNCYRLLKVGETLPQGAKVAVIQADGSLSYEKVKKGYCVGRDDAPRILISLPKVDTELERLKEELNKTQKHFEESRESMKKMREQIRKLELKELEP